MAWRNREVIQPKSGDRRFARRNKAAQLTQDQVAVGTSLASDWRTHAKKVVSKGHGDRADQKWS